MSPPERSYAHLECLGKTKLLSPLPFERNNRLRFEDTLFKRMPENLKSLREYAGEFYKVSGTVKTVEGSILKMDVPRTTKFKESRHWGSVKSFVFDKLKPVLDDPVRWNSEKIISTVNMPTSSGQPWLRHGFKKKSDFYASNAAREYLFKYNHPDGFPPVWKIVDKVEWYPVEKLDAGKVRTFIIPPAHFVHFQKMYFGNQNERLKNFWWSAYGFNPYSGGVHRMATLLNAKRVKVCFDVGGWDRSLPHMPSVYNLRMAYLDHMDPTLHWVVENTIRSFLLHPDGHLLYKYLGNNSGSGNTTTDNIIAHMLVLALALFELFDGDIQQVLDVIANLFGDDAILSFDTDKSFEEIEKIFRDVYGWFGFTLDPFIVSENLEDCTFLGFKFACYNGFWYPKFDIGRLCASFCFEYDTGMTSTDSFCKAYSLYIMACGTGGPALDLMRDCLERYKVILSSFNDELSQRLCTLEILSRDDVFKFYNGMEDGIKIDIFDVVEANCNNNHGCASWRSEKDSKA